MKKWSCVLLAIVCLLLAGCNSRDYETAMELYGAENYKAAAEAFRTLGDYEDSAAMAAACEYALAEQLYADENWVAAEAAFAALRDYEDSADRVLRCRYEQAKILLEGGAYPEAGAAFTALGEFADSREQVKRCKYEQAKVWLKLGEYPVAREIFGELGDYEDAPELLEQARWGMLTSFLIEQSPYFLGDGYQVGITASDPNQLTFYVEKVMDLGFYVVVDRCAIAFTVGEAEGKYELQTQTRTQSDGLSGRTSCTASGTVALASLTPETRLPLDNFYYHGQDVYGNVTERTEPLVSDLAEPQALLKVLLEQIPVVLQSSGSGYTLEEFGVGE